MTQEEYNQKIEDLRQQEVEIQARKREAQAEYQNHLNKPYEHLLQKKVRVVYKQWGWTPKEMTEKTEICYWGGYYLQFGEFRPRFYQVKKDGSISSRELHIYAKEILSIEEVTE